MKRFLNKIRSVVKIIALASIILGSMAQADTTNWTGLGSTDSWYNAANWDNGVPTDTSDATIANGDTVLAYGEIVSNSVEIGSASGGQSTLLYSPDASTLTVNNTMTIHAGSTYHQQYVQYGYGLVTGYLDLGGDFSRLQWDSGGINLTNSGLTIEAGGTMGGTIAITNDGLDRESGGETLTYIQIFSYGKLVCSPFSST